MGTDRKTPYFEQS